MFDSLNIRNYGYQRKRNTLVLVSVHTMLNGVLTYSCIFADKTIRMTVIQMYEVIVELRFRAHNAIRC